MTHAGGRPSKSGLHGKAAHYGGPKPPTKFERGQFVAWDGEGACLDGCAREAEDCPHPQGYVYLANSENAALDAPNGLDTRTALMALVGEGRRLPDATHVVFGLSYDANQMLRDVSRLDLRSLWTGGRIRIYRRFKVAYRPRKMLWVKDLQTGASVTLWDVFGFFQSSFIKAVEDNLGKKDPRLPLIREGKARRGRFSVDDLPFIHRYTGAELSALVDLCRHLRAAFISANLTLKRWDGAGAAAAALLEREGIKAHIEQPPKEVGLASQYAYSGGRIETRRYGYYEGPVYVADVRAAYPWGMLTLPSLKHGRWRHIGPKRLPSRPFSMVKVRWDFGRLGDTFDLLPFSFRRHTGAIYFPRRGENWAWLPEVEAALAYPELKRKVELLDAFEFVPDDEDEHPFAFMADVYRDRQRLRDSKNAAQLALKLAQNSSYGKTAQKVGGRKDRPPPYHSLLWAGMVTATTRARLFRAALTAGRGSVTIATDGLFSTEPLPFAASKDLGGWDLSVGDRMLIAQSGVYWIRWPREDDAGCDECHGPVEPGPMDSVRCVDPLCRASNLTHHFRGFDEDSLDPDRILNAWRHRWTTVSATSTRFVTLGRATLTEGQFKDWRKWVREERTLDIRACGKRIDRPTGRIRWPDRGLLDTDPADPFESVSTPYSLDWTTGLGDEALMAQEEASLR
ncbi:MAG: hypothetical protein L3K23_10405 [Thermoplasmata archaeon]|nr:hypothetical protein [Thermoplasmata archaeon]